MFNRKKMEPIDWRFRLLTLIIIVVAVGWGVSIFFHYGLSVYGLSTRLVTTLGASFFILLLIRISLYLYYHN